MLSKIIIKIIIIILRKNSFLFLHKSMQFTYSSQFSSSELQIYTISPPRHISMKSNAFYLLSTRILTERMEQMCRSFSWILSIPTKRRKKFCTSTEKWKSRYTRSTSQSRNCFYSLLHLNFRSIYFQNNCCRLKLCGKTSTVDRGGSRGSRGSGPPFSSLSKKVEGKKRRKRKKGKAKKKEIEKMRNNGWK